MMLIFGAQFGRCSYCCFWPQREFNCKYITLHNRQRRAVGPSEPGHIWEFNRIMALVAPFHRAIAGVSPFGCPMQVMSLCLLMSTASCIVAYAVTSLVLWQRFGRVYWLVAHDVTLLLANHGACLDQHKAKQLTGVCFDSQMLISSSLLWIAGCCVIL